MALIVTSTTEDGLRHHTSRWNVDSAPLAPFAYSKVLWVEVDGVELTYVLKKFGHLPYHNGDVMKWSGDFAQFIADNLGNLK